MVPTPRSHTSGKIRPTLEIIPDSRFMVFNGGEHEASNIKLTGRIRFTTPESMSIMKPKVRLEGKRKISWWFMGGISAGEVTDKRIFWNQEQKLGIESSHKVKAGTIEWPFEFELTPTMPESVEGLRETYIAYHMHASISRPGWNAKDIVAQEHIRIVRTLGQDSMEMTRSRVNADIWANKISYSISIPTDAIVFGTSITADVELSPLKKGIKLGKVELRLMETVVKRIQASEVPDIRGDRSKTDELEVAKADMEFPENSRVTYDDESLENPMLADEMFKFKATLPLPKSLNLCRQDVDTHNVNITHRFKLMVNIHNPEGHVSQLVCRLPVKLFISPNLPVDESNRVSQPINGVSEVELNQTETSVTAPPEYGRHQLDQIYSDIDPSGFMTRAGSAAGTPSGIYSQSRRGSQENISAPNGVVGDDHTPGTGTPGSPAHHGSATPSILHSRLADLQARGHTVTFRNPNGPHHSPSGGNSPGVRSGEQTPDRLLGQTPPVSNPYFPASLSAHDSPHRSAQISGRNSDEYNSNTQSAPPGDYDLSTLSRVPSYGAAIRTSGAITPFIDGPPSYVEATSRPPSPTHGAPAAIQMPGNAHLRQSGNSTPHSASSGHTLTAAVGPMQVPAIAATGRDPNQVHADDIEARLRMLRART